MVWRCVDVLGSEIDDIISTEAQANSSFCGWRQKFMVETVPVERVDRWPTTATGGQLSSHGMLHGCRFLGTRAVAESVYVPFSMRKFVDALTAGKK